MGELLKSAAKSVVSSSAAGSSSSGGRKSQAKSKVDDTAGASAPAEVGDRLELLVSSNANDSSAKPVVLLPSFGGHIRGRTVKAVVAAALWPAAASAPFGSCRCSRRLLPSFPASNIVAFKPPKRVL